MVEFTNITFLEGFNSLPVLSCPLFMDGGIVVGGIKFKGVNSLSVLSYSDRWFESTAEAFIVSDGDWTSGCANCGSDVLTLSDGGGGFLFRSKSVLLLIVPDDSR